MKITIQAIALVLLVASSAHAQQAVQWKVSEGGNGHWYSHSSFIGNWPAVRDWCEARGGHLATFTSVDEWSWAKASLPVVERFVGGYQERSEPDYQEPFGGWRWVTGEVFSPSSFIALDDCPGGSPGSCGCGAAGAQDVLFFTGCCDNVLDDIGDGIVSNCDSYSRSGIIEWSADCNNDGIVDYGQILLGQLPDTNNNGVPDTCEPPYFDCNSNSIRDDLEIASGRALDQNSNQVPDECDSVGGLPRIRSMVLNRGPGTGPGYCGVWDTREDPPGFWNLWVSRTGAGGPWINAQDPSNGLPLALQMQLRPGDNTLVIRHDFNGCDGQTQNVHLWLGDSELPSISGLGGITPSPFSGLVLGPSGSDQVPAAGTLLARVGAWNIRLESFTWALGSDMVGNFLPKPNGVADNVSTVQIRVYKDCPCDVFRDFNVNGADLGILLSQWGMSNQYTVTDFNGDGSVNGVDLGQLLAAWGPCPN